MFCFSQTVLTSLASTIKTCSRKTASLPALMCPQPCPQKRVHQRDHLLHLQVSAVIVHSHYGKVTFVMCSASFQDVLIVCVKIFCFMSYFFADPLSVSLSVCLFHQVRDRPSPEQSPPTPSNDEGTSLQETSPQPPPLPCLPRIL